MMEAALHPRKTQSVERDTYKERVIITENSYEKIDKSERKRKLKENEKEEVKRGMMNPEAAESMTQGKTKRSLSNHCICPEESHCKSKLEELCQLQQQYAKSKFDDIPENDQLRIKDLMKEINQMKPHLMEIEGNQNKQLRNLSQEQVFDELLSDPALQRKFFMAGGGGNFMLKPMNHYKPLLDNEHHQMREKAKMQQEVDIDMQIVQKPELLDQT